MNRQLIYRALFLLALTCLLLRPTFAQGGGGELPIAKPKPTPTPRRNVPAPKSAAEPKAKPTPEAKPSVPTTISRRPASQPPLAYGQEVAAKLDAKTSGRIATGNYYNEYALTASASELFTIKFQSDNPALLLQIYDPTRIELPILKDAQTGAYRLDTPTGTWPADGAYQVRVLNAGAEKSASGGYTLKFTRTGYTEAAYQDRLQKIADEFRATDGKDFDGAVKKLEQLITEDAQKPGAYEMLGVLYLYQRREPEKAIGHMEQAIKLNGAAVFRVTHDSQWRRPVRRGPQQFEWEEPRISWLRIRPNQLTLVDAGNPQQIYFSLESKLLKSAGRVGPTMALEITPQGSRKPYLLAPGTRTPNETDLIVKFIQTHVMQKTK